MLVFRTVAVFALSAVLLAGCDLSRGGKTSDADDEFAKLDQPAVLTVEQTMEKSALEALLAGENERAVALYKQLVDTNGKESRYVLGLAEAMRRDNEFEGAIDYYNQILRVDQNHMDAYEGKALALMAQGEIEEASQMMKTIVQRDPRRWRSLNALGIMFAVKGMPNEGMQYFNEAIKHSRDNPSVMNNMGLVQAMTRSYQPAVESLKRASRKAEGNHRRQIELNLALVYGISGNMEMAKGIAEKHLDAGSLQNNLGLYAHLANDTELAKSYLNMALSGSSVYYKKAWSNLDMVIDKSKNERDMTPNQKSYIVE